MTALKDLQKQLRNPQLRRQSFSLGVNCLKKRESHLRTLVDTSTKLLLHQQTLRRCQPLVVSQF